jgi:hypothetical protein
MYILTSFCRYQFYERCCVVCKIFNHDKGLGLWCLTRLSTIFQLYRSTTTVTFTISSNYLYWNRCNMLQVTPFIELITTEACQYVHSLSILTDIKMWRGQTGKCVSSQQPTPFWYISSSPVAEQNKQAIEKNHSSWSLQLKRPHSFTEMTATYRCTRKKSY